MPLITKKNKQLERCPCCGTDLRPRTTFGPISSIQTFYHDMPKPEPIKPIKQIRDEESNKKNRQLWKLQRGK